MSKLEGVNELRGLSLAAAIQRVLGHLGADSGTLHTLRPDGDLYLAAYAGRVPEALLPVIRRIPVGKGMAGVAAQRGEPVQVCNLQTDSSGVVRPGARVSGNRGAICVPTVSKGRIVGVLGVGVERERNFTGDEVAWLQLASAILAEALQSG